MVVLFSFFLILSPRFMLTNSYYKLSIQNWFTLHRIQLIYNHSIQATFNATRIHAPASYSYHCEHVSNLQRYDALLTPSSTNDAARLWEVTFIDFQVIWQKQNQADLTGPYRNSLVCVHVLSRMLNDLL